MFSVTGTHVISVVISKIFQTGTLHIPSDAKGTNNFRPIAVFNAEYKASINRKEIPVWMNSKEHLDRKGLSGIVKGILTEVQISRKNNYFDWMYQK